MKKIFFCVILLASCSSVPKSAIPESTVLRYNPAKGKNFLYHTSVKTGQEISFAGQEVNFSMLLNAITSVLVTSANSDSVGLTLRNDSSKVKIIGGEMLGVSDTTMNLQVLEKLSEKIVISPLGELINRSVEGVDDKIIAIAKQAQGSAMQSFRGLIMSYPKEQVKKGATWSNERNDTTVILGDNRTISRIRTDFVLEDIIDTLGVVAARVRYSAKNASIEGKANMMGINLRMEGEGNVTGLHYIELSNGMPLISTSRTQYDIRMALTGQENSLIPVQTDVIAVFVRKY